MKKHLKSPEKIFIPINLVEQEKLKIRVDIF